MTALKLFTLGLLAMSLSGCHHWQKHPHHGDFCPPGQAKKGNC